MENEKDNAELKKLAVEHFKKNGWSNPSVVAITYFIEGYKAAQSNLQQRRMKDSEIKERLSKINFELLDYKTLSMNPETKALIEAEAEKCGIAYISNRDSEMAIFGREQFKYGATFGYELKKEMPEIDCVAEIIDSIGSNVKSITYDVGGAIWKIAYKNGLGENRVSSGQLIDFLQNA